MAVDMARKRHLLLSLIPGSLAVFIILLFTVSSLGALWWYAFTVDSSSLLAVFNRYLWHVFFFTVYQALLSMLLSVVPALLVALAFNQQQFKGKQFLLNCYMITFILPSLVVVLGLLQVYGYTGWLTRVGKFLGVEYSGSIYGLKGILLAHVFYNFPFALRLFLQSLQAIPTEQQQLSAQLGLSRWQHFRFVESPLLLRQLLPVSAIIFMLCFSSFAVILTLGGSPKFTTLEVAIYQALRDLEFHQAVILSLIQLLFGVLLLFLLQRVTPNIATIHSRFRGVYRLSYGKTMTTIDYTLIALSLIFILLPLLAILVEGIIAIKWQHLFNPMLLQATLTSLAIAITSGVLAVTLTLMLLWSSRELDLHNIKKWHAIFRLLGMLTLAIPSMAITAGFFLLFYTQLTNSVLVFTLIVMANAVMAQPFTLKLLDHPMYDIAHRYHTLMQSLAITGFSRFYWIDAKALTPTILLAFAFASALSLGDLGIVTLFHNDTIITLPYYLLSQLSAYRSQDAAVTALLFLLLSVGLFITIQRLTKQHD